MNLRGALALLWISFAAGCDEPMMPGGGCPVVDEMVCGQASGGSSVALLCTPHAAGDQWSFVTNCASCDHVTGCKTELICNGTNVANSGLHCDVAGVGACDVNNNSHLLKCGTDHNWALEFDCSTQGKVCGLVASGSLSCK